MLNGKGLTSDSTKVNSCYTLDHALAKALFKVLEKHPVSAGYFFRMPDTSNVKSAIEIDVYPRLNSYYENQSICLDRHTLKEIKRPSYYSASYKESNAGLKLRRINYDLHVGRILGLPGKIIAFLASIIGASLPVTGFIIWYNRKFGKKSKGKRST